MRKVVEYIVIHRSNRDRLSSEVNDYIEEGYEPQGGFSSDTYGYNQAMVKYEDEEADNIKLQQAHMMEKFKMMEKIKAKDLKHEDEA